jgi:hypothetical protein
MAGRKKTKENYLRKEQDDQCGGLSLNSLPLIEY